MRKKSLITGINGQDGSYLAELLLEKGYEVWGTVKRNSVSETQSTRIEHLRNDGRLNLEYADLTDMASLIRVLSIVQPDEVYNLASQSNVRLSYENPVNTFNVTLIGTIVLLENLRKYSSHSKIFQASSSAMFGNSIDEDGFQRETTSFKPISPYASSKLFAHNISSNYRENYKMFISNGILYNHESIKSKTLFGIINTVTQKAIEIKKGLISEFYIPNLKIHLDIGSAEDYVEVMWLTLQQKFSDDYIIASGKTYSIEDICNYIFLKLDLNYKKYIKTDSNSIESSKLKGDINKIKNLGWTPKYTFEETMDKIINYYKNNINT
jgi:GDPmannose 4,6-dehydratase